MPDTFPSPRPTRRRLSTWPVRIEVGARSCWGFSGGLTALLDKLGVPYMWDPVKSTRHRRVVTFPVDRCDDLLTLLEHPERCTVELMAIDR